MQIIGIIYVDHNHIVIMYFTKVITVIISEWFPTLVAEEKIKIYSFEKKKTEQLSFHYEIK